MFTLTTQSSIYEFAGQRGTGTDNDRAWAEISDAGHGIASAVKGFRSAISSKTQGEVQLTNQSNQGSEFRITLPITGAITENA